MSSCHGNSKQRSAVPKKKDKANRRPRTANARNANTAKSIQLVLTPQPEPVDFWLLSPVSCSTPLALIQVWVSHYVDVLLVKPDRVSITLYGNTEPRPREAGSEKQGDQEHTKNTNTTGTTPSCQLAVATWNALGIYNVTVAPHPFSRCNRKADLYAKLNVLALNKTTWWTARDIDEFVVLPAGFDSLLDWAKHVAAQGYRAIFTTLIDRITETGLLKPLEEKEEWMKTYPICCELLTILSKCKTAGFIRKYVAFQGSLLSEGRGGHGIRYAYATELDGTCPPELPQYPKLNWNLPTPEEIKAFTLKTKHSHIAHLKWTAWFKTILGEHLVNNPVDTYLCTRDRLNDIFVRGGNTINKELLQESRCWTCGESQHKTSWHAATQPVW
eukprot:TRINITY_DN68022_c5_g3_i1.p1 TRINITY_DN68022_c5_g3~~TRINITY_DN68022_c5_g3_i1.p1  ORF type:complete len:386 (-),score=12.90 TRINITY_DN68022_c5_g3_i1:87-1244(-)